MERKWPSKSVNINLVHSDGTVPLIRIARPCLATYCHTVSTLQVALIEFIICIAIETVCTISNTTASLRYLDDILRNGYLNCVHITEFCSACQQIYLVENIKQIIIMIVQLINIFSMSVRTQLKIMLLIMIILLTRAPSILLS